MAERVESTKILVVDDDPALLPLIEYTFAKEGYAVSYTHLTLPTTPYV